jgi:CheY-like chemotaxis protein
VDDPVASPLGQRRKNERRRLFDRRAPLTRRTSEDRRRRDRRQVVRPVPRERRTATERRRSERRVASDRRDRTPRRHGPRRRETPTPYSVPQLEALRERCTAIGPATCPACEGTFTLGQPRRRGTEIVRLVRCRSCGKTAVVANTRAARILLVGQKDAVRDAVRGVLLGAGHDVVEAADAAVGLVAYEAVPADVVILDVLAAGRVEAADFARQLRRQYPDARIVALARRPTYGAVDPLAVVQRLAAAQTLRMPASPADVLAAVEAARP